MNGWKGQIKHWRIISLLNYFLRDRLLYGRNGETGSRFTRSEKQPGEVLTKCQVEPYAFPASMESTVHGCSLAKSHTAELTNADSKVGENPCTCCFLYPSNHNHLCVLLLPSVIVAAFAMIVPKSIHWNIVVQDGSQMHSASASRKYSISRYAPPGFVHWFDNILSSLELLEVSR